MATIGSSPVPVVDPASERALDAPELIERMAAELRTASGSELPLEYFIDQVKRGLAGQETNDSRPQTTETRRAAAGTSPSVFHSWAMPEN
ncbi:hypothetical protein [Ciceribacter sp. L1K22]|uniref:hypothetical protein n=1 Tax=Ciceribacter sp. L1K22 TaxID=2820275 RepID=UPI001ABE0FAB|nr:hypothetical protein [Ciceribacter sp. L1K22]MBO3761036.1 hypothetical protein [Ciceribacter sp. L1K22]